MQVGGSYHLKSDLARVCLPNPQGQSRRIMAWVDSICFLFLLIGIVGARTTLPKTRVVAPLEEAIPILIQPVAPPPAQAKEEQQKESTDDKSPTPRVVVVTLDSPSINFSIPTIGNVVVPNAIAVAPPSAPLRTVQAVHQEPKSIGTTGTGGDRPYPPYPQIALETGQEGTVVLLLTVDDSGVVQSVTIKETSGSSLLDRSAKEFVKRHWIVPPGPGGRVFQATISYKIQS
jgi:TonB family protein